jgi:hypothetical protein
MIFPQEPISTEREYEARIARKRQLEAERRSRIFNPKLRTLGVDIQGLGKQVFERQQSAKRERQESLAYGQWVLELDQKARLEQSLTAEQCRQECKELDSFRLSAQRRELRRDFDLYDPRGLAKTRPTRSSDNDPNVPVSSLQKFSGEDLEKEHRLRTQQNQMNVWVMEQLFGKAENRSKELEYQRYVINI